MKIEIQKGVPIPLKSLRLEYPFDEMNVGDSFFIPVEDSDLPKVHLKISAKACYYTSRHDNKTKFTTKK